MSRKRRVAANLALVLAGVAMAFLVAEVAVRVSGLAKVSLYTWDAYRGWGLKPGASGWQREEGAGFVSVNRAGFRGPAMDDRQAAGHAARRGGRRLLHRGAAGRLRADLLRGGRARARRMQGAGRQKSPGDGLRDRRLRHGAGVGHAAPACLAVFARHRGAGFFFGQRSAQQLDGAGERQVPPVLRLRGRSS